MDDIFARKNILTRNEFRNAIDRKFSNDYTPEVVDILYDELARGGGEGVSRRKVEERLRETLPFENDDISDDLEEKKCTCPSHFLLFVQRGVNQVALLNFAARTIACAGVALLEGSVHQRSLPQRVGHRME